MNFWIESQFLHQCAQAIFYKIEKLVWLVFETFFLMRHYELFLNVVHHVIIKSIHPPNIEQKSNFIVEKLEIVLPFDDSISDIYGLSEENNSNCFQLT